MANNKKKSEIFTNDFNKTNHVKNDVLPEKVFVARNSLLTDLYDNKHILTIYYMFVAAFIGLFVNSIFYDYKKYNRLYFGFRLIIKGFGNIHLAFLLWLCLLLVVFLTYVCFNIWAGVRIRLSPKSFPLKLWDRLCLSALINYYFFSYYWMFKFVVLCELPPCSTCVVVTEYTRFLMKIHSFVRTNAPKILNYKTHSEKTYPLPKFSKFLYFLFAPTLIYRDEYPRTKEINWRNVLICIIEFIVILFYLSFITERFLVPAYEDFCLRKYTWIELTMSATTNGVAGMFYMLLVFYCTLHTVQNGFAEVLRFADRMFYTDWWTSTTLSRYYRTWNIVVHDWLYTYLYKDMYEILMPKNRVMAKFVVFFISAVMHELMLCLFMRLFLPILFIEFFGIGMLFYFVSGPKHGVSNILLMYGIAQGAGISLSFYAIEMFARHNYPMDNDPFWKFFIPRSFICDSIE